jgi:hypothetical protein
MWSEMVGMKAWVGSGIEVSIPSVTEVLVFNLVFVAAPVGLFQGRLRTGRTASRGSDDTSA